MGGLVSKNNLVRLLVGPTLVAILFTILSSGSAFAQEPTPTAIPASGGSGDGFFSGFQIADLISLITAGVTLAAVGGLALWVVRIKNAEISLVNERLASVSERKDVEIEGLNSQVTAAKDDIAREKRNSEHLEKINAKSEAYLNHQIKGLESQAGTDESGQVSASGSKLAEAEQEQLREILSLVQEMKASQDALDPEEERPERTAGDLLKSGNAYYAAGEHERALSEYNRALRIQPDNVTVLFNRGNALERLGRYEEALQAFDQAVALRPDHADSILNRGVVLDKLGRPDEALQAFDQAVALRPDHATSIMSRGVALRQLGRYKKAVQAYNQALALRPDDAYTLSNRGVARSHTGDYTSALADFDRAHELDPDNNLVMSNRAVILGLLGRHDEALSEFTKALASSAEDPGVYYDRASYHAIQINADLALTDLEQAIVGDSWYAAMAATDAFFDNIRDDPRFQELVGEAEPQNESAESEDNTDD